MVRRSSPNTLGKSGVSLSVLFANRGNVAQRVWPWQTHKRKGEQKCSSGRKRLNEANKQKELTADSREEGKPHRDSKVKGEPYTLHFMTVSKKHSLTLFN
jgi:hypothetical protein